jgi:hypothetical protein
VPKHAQQKRETLGSISQVIDDVDKQSPSPDFPNVP